MISKLHDAVAIDACEMRILESTRRLDYLERELRNYELKRLVKINPSSASAAGSSANNSGIGGGGGGASSTIVRKQQQQQQLGVNGTPVLPTISPITPLLSANTLLTTYNLPNPEPPLMESKSLPPVPHPPLSGDISLIRPSSATAATGDLVDDTSTLDYNEITTPSPVLDFSPHFNLGPSSSNNNNNKRNSDPGLVPSNSDYSYSSGPTSGRHSVYVDTPNAGDGGGDVAASSSATANTTNYNNTTSPSVVASATGYSLQHISNVTPSRSVQQYHQPHPSQSPPSSSLSFNRLSIDPNNNNNNSLMNASFVSTSQPHLAQRTSVFETIFSSFGVGKGRSSTISGARSATSSISSLNSSVNNSEMFASKTSYTQFGKRRERLGSSFSLAKNPLLSDPTLLLLPYRL